MEILRKEPSIGVVTTGACLFNEQGEIVRLAIPRIDRNIFPEILVRNKVGNCSAVLARRCCLERAGLFDENLHAAEDFDMWIRLAKHCQFACVQEHLLFCRTHIKQISRDYDRVLKATKMLFRKHSVELAALPSHESKRILASWHNELGLLYSQLGAYENARKEFMMAVSNNPFSVLLLARLFKLSLNQRTAELFTSMLDRRFAVSSRWKHMFNSRNRRMRSRSSG
jgi:tetratricopeptide (TPR) repeat protein